jgi:hypothetical protein
MPVATWLRGRRDNIRQRVGNDAGGITRAAVHEKERDQGERQRQSAGSKSSDR